MFWSCGPEGATTLPQQQQPTCGPTSRVERHQSEGDSSRSPDNSFTDQVMASRNNLRSTPSPTKFNKTFISNLDRVQKEGGRTRSPPGRLAALSSQLADPTTASVTVDSSFNSESPLLQQRKRERERDNTSRMSKSTFAPNSESTIEIKPVAGTDWDVAWSRAGSTARAAATVEKKSSRDASNLTRSTSPGSAETASSAASSIYSDEFKRKSGAQHASSRQAFAAHNNSDSFDRSGLSTPPKQTISRRNSPPTSPFRSRSGETPPNLDDSNEESDDTEKMLSSTSNPRRPKRKPKKEVILFPVEEEPAVVRAKEGSLLQRVGRTDRSPSRSRLSMSPVRRDQVARRREPVADTLPIIEDTNEPFQDDDTMSEPYARGGTAGRLGAVALNSSAELSDSQRSSIPDSWNSDTPGCWKKRLERTQQYANSIRGIDTTPDGYDDLLHPNTSSPPRPEYDADSSANPLDEFDDWKNGPWANIRSSSSSTISTNHQSLPSPMIVRKMKYCQKFLELENGGERPAPSELSDDGNGSKLDTSLTSLSVKERALEPFKMCVKCLLD